MEQFPATYMTSFICQGRNKAVLRELVRAFPAVTVLELDLVIKQVERIFRQVTLAVEYVLVFVLLAGFAVLFAALQASQDEDCMKAPCCARWAAVADSYAPDTWLNLRRWAAWRGWLRPLAPSA